MAKQIAVELLMILAIGLVLGLFGPFGTFDIPTAARLAYWMSFGVIGYAIFRPLTVAGRWLSETFALPPMIGTAIALFVAAMPMTGLVAFMLSGFDAGRASRWDGLGLLYFQVWLIGFLTNSFFLLMFRDRPTPQVRAEDGAPPAAPPSTPSESSLTDRLPPGFGPILALKGEDHYVRAFGETCNELVLARLRDAVAGLGAVEGIQVHRSWWVSRSAIASARREGRTGVLTLSNGVEVPVSRESLPAVRSTGWVKGL